MSIFASWCKHKRTTNIKTYVLTTLKTEHVKIEEAFSRRKCDDCGKVLDVPVAVYHSHYVDGVLVSKQTGVFQFGGKQ